MKKSLLLPLVLILSLFSAPAYSQVNATDEQTVTYLNKMLSGRAKILFNKKKAELTVDFYRGAEHYRQDIFFLADMNPNNISYSKEEKAVVIRCNDGGKNPDCIDRKLITMKKRNGNARINFEMAETESEKFMKAFKHLISLYSDENYSGTITLE